MELPAELVDQLRVEPPAFEVWPQNMVVVDTFLAIATQWHITGLADGRVLWQGLDYARAKAGLELAAIAIAPATWAGVQVIERTAARTLNGNRS